MDSLVKRILLKEKAMERHTKKRYTIRMFYMQPINELQDPHRCTLRYLIGSLLLRKVKSWQFMPWIWDNKKKKTVLGS